MRWMAALMVVLVVGGCSGEKNAAPEIAYGRDVCEQCGMIIEDPRFAAAYRDDSGEEHLFDEIGGMLVAASTLGHLESGAFWVNDYSTQSPIPASEAHFVHGASITTPMDFRIVAFAQPGAAKAFAALNGGVEHTWADLVELALADDIVPNPEVEDNHLDGGG